MDQRKFSRAALTLTARICYADSEVSGEVENVSLYGLFVKTDAPAIMEIPEHSEVDVAVQLTGTDSHLKIEFKGTVARVEESHGLAIQLENLGVDAFLHWKNIVSYATGDPDSIEEQFASYIAKRQG